MDHIELLFRLMNIKKKIRLSRKKNRKIQMQGVCSYPGCSKNSEYTFQHFMTANAELTTRTDQVCMDHFAILNSEFSGRGTFSCPICSNQFDNWSFSALNDVHINPPRGRDEIGGVGGNVILRNPNQGKNCLCCLVVFAILAVTITIGVVADACRDGKNVTIPLLELEVC